MTDWAAADLAGMELCRHGERLKFCSECSQGVSAHPAPSGLTTSPVALKAGVLREAAIQEECIRFMAEDGWTAMVTTPVSDKGRGIGFGELGMADVQFRRPLHGSRAFPVTIPVAAAYECQLLSVEFKAGREKLKKHQEAWHTNERARGFMTWKANEDFQATVEGFSCYYRESGLMRRKS